MHTNIVGRILAPVAVAVLLAATGVTTTLHPAQATTAETSANTKSGRILVPSGASAAGATITAIAWPNGRVLSQCEVR